MINMQVIVFFFFKLYIVDNMSRLLGKKIVFC